MSKHTPGPWIIDMEGNRILADDDRATIIVHASCSLRNPEMMADARLIAAAPMLYEALQRVQAWSETLWPGQANEPSSIAAQVAAALRAAEGAE